MQKIYLDYAATTPTDPQVTRLMEPYFFERFGNASSVHFFGQEAKKAIENSRQFIAQCLGAQPQEIVFTSGGSESNNSVVFGVAHALRSKGNHIIISAIEHHSVMEAAHRLAKEGFKVTTVGVDQAGLIDPQDIQKAITDKTILISVMHANNEIGTIEPIAEIGAIARDKGIYFHSDGVQTVGHVPVNVHNLNVDLLSMAAHKFYGPPGVGALYIRKGTRISPFILGGGQERNRRASTHNLPGIVGMGEALRLCQEKMRNEIEEQTTLRDKIINTIKSSISDSLLNGHPAQRLANNINFTFMGVNGESLLMSLDMVGIAASMGAACTSGALEPSYVLRAIGLSDDLALSSLRLSLGRWTTQEHMDHLLNELPPIVKRLRLVSPSFKR